MFRYLTSLTLAAVCLSAADNLPRIDLHVHLDAEAKGGKSDSGPHASGRSVWLWLPDVTFAAPQDFMDRHVEFNLRALAQRIQVWANPTFIPESMKARYDELWTPARMDRLIAAAVKNHVSIEINAHFQVPSAAFIRRAKAAGATFCIGSNRHAQGIGEIEYCLRMARNCGLTAKDFFVPSDRKSTRL